MANPKASLYWHAKTETGWRRFPVVYAPNGRIKTGVVLVDGKEHKYPTGSFHLRTITGFESVGTDQSEALGALARQRSILAARLTLAETGAQIVVPEKDLTLDQQRKEFMIGIELQGGSRSCDSVYRITVEGFLASASRRVYAHQIVLHDVQMYIKGLRDAGYSDSTLFTRSRRLLRFLRFAGVEKEHLPKGKQLPPKPKPKPEIYTEDEMRAFLDGCTHDNDYSIIFETYLKTGLRERELLYLEPKNLVVDGPTKLLQVRNKPHLGFRIKDTEERDIALGTDLAERLLAHREKRKGCKLLFGTRNDKARRHLIRVLKREAFRLGLACEHCPNCIAKEECEQWYLHKFRATYATTCLQRGMDVRTLMEQMGHSDIQTTLHYLTAARHSNTQNLMDNIWSGVDGNVVAMPKPHVHRRRAS
jgi:integrase